MRRVTRVGAPRRAPAASGVSEDVGRGKTRGRTRRQNSNRNNRNKMNPYAKLARIAVTKYLKSGKIIIQPKNLPKKMLSQKAGVFVSIHEKNKKLRGCIGTFLPTTQNIASEIISNAIKATTLDPRFLPVRLEELDKLYFSVDVLAKSQKITNIKKQNPKKDGLIVSGSGDRRGLLLPDITGVETPEKQLEICLTKANISSFEKYTLQTFKVKRFEEKGYN